MNKYQRNQKKQSEYKNVKLRYSLEQEQKFNSENQKVFDKMKDALENSGFTIEIDKSGVLTIGIMETKYVRKNFRNAGRRERTAERKSDFLSYRYSDIVHMNQTMTDKQVIEKIGMPQATYYRHKKEMKDSVYYKNLDKARLTDLDYLNSLEGNKVF